MHELSADVIVVGAGGAGTYAALTLKKHGLDPLLVTKGFVGKSGCSIFAGNLAGGSMLDGTKETGEVVADFFIRWMNHFLIDQTYAKSAAAWLDSDYFPELDEAGLYFRRDDQGDLVMSKGKGRVAAANQQGQSGVLFMDRRRKQVRQNDVRTLEETAITSLLTDEGRVVGATGLHYPSGEVYAIRAKAVVLATGHSDRIAIRSTGTREQSADGIALAARVGAEMCNLEIQWWHASDFAHPNAWQRMHVYPNPLLGSAETARMFNTAGELFFEQKTDAPHAIAPYATQFKLVGQQVLQGKARYDGGYFTSYEHIDPAVIKTYNSHAKAFEKLGLKSNKDRIETAVSWHFRQGGIHVDPATLQSSVPGLFVAGGIGGHHNGSIGIVTFDGKRVAESISGHDVMGLPLSPLPRLQVAAEIDRLNSLLRPIPADGTSAMELKSKIRQLMWDHMGFVKTESGMTAGLEKLQSWRHQKAPVMGIPNLTRRFNYSWVDAIDVFNMLDVCELTIHSALNRKESRGPFYRPEFPYTDNENWLKRNILKKERDGTITFRDEPYETPYWTPEFQKQEYFSVRW